MYVRPIASCKCSPSGSVKLGELTQNIAFSPKTLLTGKAMPLLRPYRAASFRNGSPLGSHVLFESQRKGVACRRQLSTHRSPSRQWPRLYRATHSRGMLVTTSVLASLASVGIRDR